MIMFSVSLINFNNWLMKRDRFPHALLIVLIQMCFCTLLSLLLLMLKPSLFPSLTDPDTKIGLDRYFVLKSVLPIAVVFAASINLSNMVYAHLGLAFIQMIKETNVIWVYILSIICALERLSMRACQVICIALVAMALTLKGQMHFELLGFVIAITAVLCDAGRVVLQSVLLYGKRLDPLSYVLLISPSCGVLVMCTILVIMTVPSEVVGPDLALPTISEVVHWAPWLVADSMLAFSLNISISMVIQDNGPLTYIMCGIMKDVVAVGVSITILHESVSILSGFGFVLQLFAVLTWFLLKADPDKFKSGIVSGLMAHILPQNARDPELVPEVPEVLEKVPEKDEA